LKTIYTATYWGCESLSADSFFSKVLAHGYNGIEICLPDNAVFIKELTALVKAHKQSEPDFKFILQHITAPQGEAVDSYVKRDLEALSKLADIEPDFINAHTGKDYFTFEQNCTIINGYRQFEARSGIPVVHETHRGRFSFHASSLLPYLNTFPELKLAADFSHFCTVSESLMEHQQDILEKIMPHIAHIHARVGFEQGPQVSNPFAPEWQLHLDTFVSWWLLLYKQATSAGRTFFTITPECGPAPYMPLEPFTQKPLANQWSLNVQMMQYLKQKINDYATTF